jgi:hypothetical protein
MHDSICPRVKDSIGEWLGAEAEYMTIRILNVHLERPGVVPRRAADLGPLGLVLFVQRRNVLDTDPRPGATTALSSAAKIDPGSIPIHGREVVGTPVDVPKAEHIDIVTGRWRAYR